jgi:hypothetical protein
MEIYLTANQQEKGKKILFQYPNLITNNHWINLKLRDKLALKDFAFLKKKVNVEDQEDYGTMMGEKAIHCLVNQKRKNTISELSHILDKIERNLNFKLTKKEFIEMCDHNLSTNGIMKNLKDKYRASHNSSLYEFIVKYYDSTVCNGSLDKSNCMGFSVDFVLNLIHKISNEGYFKFQINDRIIFGYKFRIFEISEVVYLENEFFKENANSKTTELKRVNEFYVFMSVKEDNVDLIDLYKEKLYFIGNLLTELERDYWILTYSYYDKFSNPVDMVAKDPTRMEDFYFDHLIFYNYLLKLGCDDLLKLLTEFSISIFNKQDFKFGKNTYKFSDLLKLKSLKKTLLMNEASLITPGHSLAVFDKKKLIKECHYNRIKTFLQEITPNKSLAKICSITDFKFDEVLLYVEHLIFWNKAKLIYPLSNSSVISPCRKKDHFLSIIATKTDKFFKKYKLYLLDIMAFFYGNLTCQYQQFKQYLFKFGHSNPEKIILFLLKYELIELKSEMSINNQTLTDVKRRKHSFDFDYNQSKQRVCSIDYN